MLSAISGAGTAAALSVAVAGPAGAESLKAKEHVVVILTRSYFPTVTYAQPGDTIRFVNESGLDHVVTGNEVAWNSGIIEAEGEVIVTVLPGMHGDYFGGSNPMRRGAISFEPSSLAD